MMSNGALRSGVDTKIEPLRGRDVLHTARRVYHRRFARVAGTALVIFGVLAVVDGALTSVAADTDDPRLRASLVGAAAFVSFGSTFYAGLLDRLVGAHAFGHPEESFIAVLRSLRWGRLIIADTVLTLVTAAGSIFLLVPGLVAFTFFALVGPLINIEELTVAAAFRRSARLVRHHFWLVAVLVTLPVAIEGELEAIVELAAHGESLLVAFAAHGLFGAIVGACVGLIEVTLAYELTARHPAR